MKKNWPKSQTSVCACVCVQLRSGTLSSAEETDRFTGPPEREKSLLCDLSETEDEIHFMFYCSLHDDLNATRLSEMSFISDEFL